MDQSELCRICGTSDAAEMFRLSDRLLPIDGRSTAQVIEDCFGLSISDDELSSFCCVYCKQDIAVSLKLITRIRESDIRMKSFPATYPKKEDIEPLNDGQLLSTIFIAEPDIKLEEPEEPFDPTLNSSYEESTPVKKTTKRGRGRPKKVKVEDESKGQTEEMPVAEESGLESTNAIKKEKRRTSTNSMRSDEPAFSASEGSDFEPDKDSDSDEEADQRSYKRFYGVKADSQPRRCCSCKSFPLDSIEKVQDHSNKYHTRPQGSNEHSDKTFECSVCFARFENKKEFRQHERKMYVDVLHSCKHCDEQFANPYVLQKHLKNNHQRRLKIHEMEDMCIASNICCGCREQFESQEKLKEHSEQVHLPKRESRDNPTSVECDVCYKVFKSARYIKEHRLRFFKKKNYVCTQCGKSFRERSQLEGHEDSHRNVRKYECPVCHAQFSMKSSYTVHVRYHGAEESFHCEYCGKAFKKKGLMKAHQRVHNMNRPHKCSICPMTFSQKNRFDSHMLEHSGLKNFKCDQCPASYIHQRALRRHVKEKHEGIFNFKCTICPKGFVELKPLLVHLKTHEKDNEASFSKGNQPESIE